jgi:hypothetical protein
VIIIYARFRLHWDFIKPQPWVGHAVAVHVLMVGDPIIYDKFALGDPARANFRVRAPLRTLLAIDDRRRILEAQRRTEAAASRRLLVESHRRPLARVGAAIFAHACKLGVEGIGSKAA